MNISVLLYNIYCSVKLFNFDYDINSHNNNIQCNKQYSLVRQYLFNSTKIRVAARKNKKLTVLTKRVVRVGNGMVSMLYKQPMSLKVQY